MYYTLKYLSQKYELYFLSFGDDITDDDATNFLNQHCAFWKIYPLKKRSLLSGLPYFFSCWQSDRLERMIGKILDEHHIEKIRLEFTQIAYLRRFLPRGIPVTFVAHDISTISFRRRQQEKIALNSPLTWLRAGMAHANTIEITAFEKMWLPLFDEVVAVSAHDADKLRQLFALKNVRLEPNGIDHIDFLPASTRSQLTCGYIGSPMHPPNREAINFTQQQILPQLTQQNVDYHYYLAGCDHEPSVNPQITILGQLAQTHQFYSQIDFLLAPIFAGSGTRVKILESLSQAIPVITTPIGAEGLNLHSPFLQIIDARDRSQLAQEMSRQLVSLKNNYQRLFADHENRQRLKKQLKPYLWQRSFAYS